MTEPSLPVRWVGSVAVAVAPAEVDLTNAGEILEGLLALVADGPSMLVVDMTQTTFCDSAGAATLIQAHRTAAVAQVPLRLAASEAVTRILALLGLDRLMDIQPSMDGLGGAEPPPPGTAAGGMALGGAP
jgi:anti-sigma B factor antagonist